MTEAGSVNAQTRLPQLKGWAVLVVYIAAASVATAGWWYVLGRVAWDFYQIAV
jgi:hypothetical protein